jgi:hypothetical protein
MDDYDEFSEDDFDTLIDGGDIYEDETPKKIIESDDISSENKVVITKNTMDVYKPKITRKIMSIYEFVGVITKLADYLYHLDDLTGIIEDQDSYTYINHVELAWALLRDKKYDAILNRYVEQVNFSELDINPHWIEVIEHDFKLHAQSFEEDVLGPLELIKILNK